MTRRNLKSLFIGGFLGMSLCLGVQAQEEGRTSKTVQAEIRAAQKVLGKKAGEVKKANKEAFQPLADQQKELSTQQRALQAQINAKLAELDPEYKDLSDKLDALRQEQKDLKAKENPPRKKKGAKKDAKPHKVE